MIDGIILAAGLSSRMEKFKPFLPIGDTTFIKHLILQMRTVGVKNITVVSGYRHQEIVEHLKDESVVHIYNENFYQSEMLDSVKLGIASLSAEADEVLLSPVDVVMSPLWIFDQVIHASGDFVRPVYGGEPGHPVLIRKSLFRHILQYEGEGGLRAAVESSDLQITNLEVDEPDILLDADTPQDYRKVLSKFNKSMGETGQLFLDLKLNLVADDFICTERFIQLLSLLESTKSLTKSAQAMNLSYTKVWQMVKALEDKFAVPFIDRQVGGKNGGKSELTLEGRTFLTRYRRMFAEIEKNAQEVFKKYFADMRF